MTTLAPANPVTSNPLGESLAGNYFISVYPPFSSWQPNHIPALQYTLDGAPAKAPLGVYVHIPFCEKKCDYCYYLSYTGQSAGTVHRYLRAVARELQLYSERAA